MTTRLKAIGEAESVAVISNAFSLPVPPMSWAVVPLDTRWRPTVKETRMVGVMPKFDLAIWSNAALTLMAPHLYGAVSHPGETAPVNTSAVDHTQETLTVTAHTFLSGDGPFNLSATTLPAGLDSSTNYWLIKVDANTLRLALNQTDALSGIFITFTDNGVGAVTISDTSVTELITWHDYGLINCTDIVLTGRVGFVVRVNHHPTVLAYGIGATMSVSDPEGVSAAIYPVEPR